MQTNKLNLSVRVFWQKPVMHNTLPRLPYSFCWFVILYIYIRFVWHLILWAGYRSCLYGWIRIWRMHDDYVFNTYC